MATLLTAKEAARYLGRAESTLKAWRKTGRGPAFYRVGNRPQYVLEELEEWAAGADTRMGAPIARRVWR
jgi:hypothetical protein